MSGEPFRQGHLDGLCGLYAIVNALDLLRDGGLTHDEDEATRILRALIDAVPERFPKAIWDGTKVQHIRRMLAAADLFARKRYRFGLVWSEPFLRRDFNDARSYHAALRAELGDGDLAIIGLAPPWDHWTLVRKALPEGFETVDSIEINFLPVSDLAIRKRASDKPPADAEFVLDIHQVFVLKRVEVKKAQRAKPRVSSPRKRGPSSRTMQG